MCEGFESGWMIGVRSAVYVAAKELGRTLLADDAGVDYADGTVPLAAGG